MRVPLLVLGATILLIPGWPALAQTTSVPALPGPQASSTESDAYMSETLRSSVKKAIVIGGESPASEAISGSYEKETAGLVGGMNQGSRLGTISQEIGGVNVNFPIPILTIPGAIFGGLSGTAKREIQEFRDALTEELAEAESKPLTNDGLALDVYRELGKLSSLETKLFAPTTPIPNDTDAILFVSFDEIGIDVQGKEAVITVSAKATLRRASDGSELYETVVRYQDRDTLSNWTDNDNALWRDYANFAAHYLSREISAAVFDRIELRPGLRPKESDTVARVKKNEWQGVSKSTRPTLAWELTLPGGGSQSPWAVSIDESDIYYDVEIYDVHRLVYAGKQAPEPRHTLSFDIDACKSYRWSVRPSYHVDGDIRFGEWMRFKPDTDTETETATVTATGNGSVGRKASEAPAYIQDFATLKIKCGRR